MGSRPKILHPKYKVQNPILLGPKYKAQNKFYTTIYNIYK